MGAFCVLLTMAVGITYGWQPDDRGGVEYVIQVPPEQLDEIERWGEIACAIDPSVQGHVSRVIIRVGDQPLPRITPPDLAIASTRENAAAGSERVVVMKPDANDRLGPFSFPIQGAAIQGAATQGATTQGATTQGATSTGGSGRSVDAAGREIDTRIAPGTAVGQIGAARTNRIPPPATRTPPLSAAPRSTSVGGDDVGGLATIREGGPSTDPTDTRGNVWGNLGSGRSATAVGNAGASAVNSGFGGGVNGVTSRDTFGKTPNVLMLPSGSDSQAERWSVDAMGRPLDRDGNVLTAAPNPNLRSAAPNPNLRSAAPNPNLRSAAPNPNQRSAALTAQTNGEPISPRNYQPPSQSLQSFGQPRPSPQASLPDSSRPTATGPSQMMYNPNDLAARRNELGAGDQLAYTEAGDQELESETLNRLASQPFFNLLLLLSIVANVYLVLWLRNLRVQFHELVVAKRISHAKTASSPATD